jgi:CRP-like cAMP-binding protein
MSFYELFEKEPNVIVRNAGEYLFRDGELGHTMYVLLEGKAQVMLDNEVLEVIERGGVVGELAVINPGPRTGAVRLLLRSRFAMIDERRFLYLVSQKPQFAMMVMQTMARRMRSAMEMLHAAKAGGAG